MAITVFWDAENKRILRIDFEGQWSWANYDKAVDEAAALIREVHNNVTVIFNLLHGPDIPHEIASSHLLRSLRLIPQNATSLFVVGASPLAEAILVPFFRSTFRLSGRKITTSSRLEGVYAGVAKQGL